jgi:hypothetical protein
MDSGMSESNGSGVTAQVADVLEDEVSVGYRPTMPLEAMWMAGGGDMPQITLRRDLEFMQLHPIVSSALEYYKSGIAGAEFWGGPDQANPQNDMGKPISPDPRVAQFVLAHVERFWQRGVPVLQEGGYPYGWAPGEHIYKEKDGLLLWSHLKGFHPNDGFILSVHNEAVGIRVKNIRDDVGGTSPDKLPSGGTVDLWFASNHIPAKAAWYPHRPRFNQFYGRSQLIGAWRPWRRLGWRDALEQVIDAAVYRAGYKGPVVRHPKEDTQTALQGVPATQQDSRGQPRRSARDVARQMVEWAKAGAGFTLSSEQYPQTMGGGPKWDIEWPDHVMDVRPLIEAARYLEEQIMLGMGVPPELLKPGGTGSGYSGRSIPREAFLDQQQRIADFMLQIFVEQVIRPLVLCNFGDVPFNVQCKSLLMSQSDSKQGEQQGSQSNWQAGTSEAKQQQQQGNQAGPGVQQKGTGPGGGQFMSLDNPTYRRALDIVSDVVRRRAA